MERPVKQDYHNWNIYCMAEHAKELNQYIDELEEEHKLLKGDYEDQKACFTDVLQEATQKLEKYKWHDLTENPNDLPRSEVVNICYETKAGYMYSVAIYSGYKWILGEVDADLCNKVIAWKYIERFEDVEEFEDD